jgi:hypothetical protein
MAKGGRQNDPDSVDPMQWMGQAALDYLNNKKKNEILKS